MQIHLDAIAARLPARFSVLVDGPDELAILGRLAAAGDRSVPLADLVATLTARGVPPPQAATTVRAVLARLQAASATEMVGGGFRLLDPGLAPALRGEGGFLLAPNAGAAAPAGAPPALPAPTGVDVTAYLQRLAVPRAGAPVEPAVASGAPPASPGSVAGTTAALVDAGWSSRSVAGIRLLTPPATPRPGVLLLVGGGPHAPASLPLQVADRAPAGGTVVLLPPAAPAAGGADGAPVPSPGAPTVTTMAERLAALVPAPRIVADAPALPLALALAARDPGVRFVFDVRGAVLPGVLGTPVEPTAATPGGAAAAPVDLAAASVAGAAGVPGPPARRERRRTGRLGRIAEGLAAVLGPQLADVLASLEAAGDDADGEGGEPGWDLAGHDGPSMIVVDPGVERPPAGGLPLPDVDVRVMADDEAVLEEVLAWLDDGDGERLLPPLT